jgi:hypothetical protein
LTLKAGRWWDSKPTDQPTQNRCPSTPGPVSSSAGGEGAPGTPKGIATA